MVEIMGTICLYLGSTVFPLLPLPFPLPSSSNDFQLSYCPCIKLPDSVNRFQYNNRKKSLIFFLPSYSLREVIQQLK